MYTCTRTVSPGGSRDENSAVAQVFTEDDIDGENLVALRPKLLLRMLRTTSTDDPAATAGALMEARDGLHVLSAQEGRSVR